MTGEQHSGETPYAPRGARSRRVGEAALSYLAGKDEMPRTTISSKYQITLPARLVREMGLKPGDQLAVEMDSLRLILHPRPKDWVSYTAGSMPGYYGKTKAEVDEYLREVRGSWGTYLDEEEDTGLETS
jgi:AbrB family looped-hinge helix DNA binding protein